MNHHIKFFILFFAIISACVSCNNSINGEGEVGPHKRNLNSFNSIKIETNADVYINVSAGSGCTIMAQDNIAEAIETKVVDNTLVIFSHRNFNVDEPVVIQVNMSEVGSLDIAGAGNIFCKSPIASTNLTLGLSGAGSMELTLAAINLDAILSGAGNINLRGSAENATIKLSGAGKINADQLVINDCKVSVSGVGNATVNVNEELDAKVTGAGNIYYSGKVTDVKTKISGIGKIEREK
ncbi:MAG: DUF2807 domain-containing protein [Bacteroidetes bacterium]|nr:DUF2807 domain-containing protein [Bacteroidota bacterium]